MFNNRDRAAENQRPITANMTPWFQEIRRELAARDRACSLRHGPLHEYVRPADVNPYSYKSAYQLDKHLPFNQDKNCKLITRDTVRPKLDSSGRYYENIRHFEACKKAKGVWKGSAINRANKYEPGTCFVNNDEGYCGSTFQNQAALRPMYAKNKEIQKQIRDTQNSCNIDMRCKWVPTGKYTGDCVGRNKATKDARAAAKAALVKPTIPFTGNPPDNMPKDATKDNMEKYLYDWYVRKAHGMTPPDTNDLFGQGDRCNPAKSKDKLSDSSPSINKQPTKRKFKDYRELLKSSPESHEKELKEVLGPKYNRFIALWKRSANNPVAQEQLYLEHFPWDEDDINNGDIPQTVAEDVANTGLLPSVPQSVVNMVMKNIAKNPDITNRGVLAWHSTGSGKTCTATGVIDAFWDDPDRQIIFTSSIDAIASNPDYNFHLCAYNLYKRFQSAPFLGKNKEDTLKNIADAFEKRKIRFLSFAKLSNRVKKFQEYIGNKKGGAGKATTKAKKPKSVATKQATTKTTTKSTTKSKKIVHSPKGAATKAKSKRVTTNAKNKKVVKSPKARVARASPIKKVPVGRKLTRAEMEDLVDLDKCILIIDEVHNLFRPLATQKAQHEYLEKHLVDPKMHPNLKVVILTATPGDNVPDVIKLLNIIRDPTHEPITAPNLSSHEDIIKFKQSIRGMVSFFDMSSDLTKFPKVIDIDPIRYPMNPLQFSKYVEAYKELKDTSKDFVKLAKANQVGKYYAAARKYANMLYNFDKDMGLSDFSSKLPALLDNITQVPNYKHYVYSAFYENRGYGGHGILAIAKELDKLGYEKLTVAQAKSLNAAGKLPEPKKRYILATQKEIGEEGSSTAGKNLGHLIKIYNSPANAYGEYVHVMLASQGFNEGIDLKAVRHIHIFEPLVTWASDKQTIGRAARYCSHADLDRSRDEWVVTINRYMSDLPIDLVRPSTDSVQAQVDTTRKEIEILRVSLETLDKKTQKDEIKSVKVQIKEKEGIVKALEKDAKKLKKMDLSMIKNVEEMVYEESRERMKSLLVIYQAMKEAALDCRILQQFHSSTGNKVTCELFESPKSPTLTPPNYIKK